MKYLKLFENFDLIQHLKSRGVNPEKTKIIMDEEEGNVYFFLYNLSGQIVGYQKYNPNYIKKGQGRAEDPKKVKDRKSVV